MLAVPMGSQAINNRQCLLLYGLTAPGNTVEDIAEGIGEQLERLKTELVDEATLERVKTQARAGLLGVLDSNNGMASLLAEYQAKTGDWRNVFVELQAIESVTAADVQRGRARDLSARKSNGW